MDKYGRVMFNAHISLPLTHKSRSVKILIMLASTKGLNAIPLDVADDFTVSPKHAHAPLHFRTVILILGSRMPTNASIQGCRYPQYMRFDHGKDGFSTDSDLNAVSYGDEKTSLTQDVRWRRKRR